MLSRLSAFVIWASVAAAAAFWALRLSDRPMPLPKQTVMVATADAYQGDLRRLFGGDTPVSAPGAPEAVPTDARFHLIGVVAPRSAKASDEGLAVIAFDGRPAKAYRVGATVDGDLVLQSVHARGAALGPSGQAPKVALELAALPMPATGLLPAANADDTDDAAAPQIQPMPTATTRPTVAPAPPSALPRPPPPAGMRQRGTL